MEIFYNTIIRRDTYKFICIYNTGGFEKEKNIYIQSWKCIPKNIHPVSCHFKFKQYAMITIVLSVGSKISRWDNSS